MIVFFFCCLLFLPALHAAPIKVPREICAGSSDKRIHPGHYPFISYLTFRAICDKVIDDFTEWFDPEDVKQGDTIYLNVSYLGWFVKHVHDRIPHPYILVSCDVGAWLPHPEMKKLLYDPKLAAWFCRNSVFSYHPKVFQIPTGQDLGLFILDDPRITFSLLEAVANKTLPKKHLLYMCHYPRAFGERDQLVKLFENAPYCLSRNHSNRSFEDICRPVFYREMSTCQFALSPLGLETDSIRTWEALVLDCMPIVEHTFLDALYDRLPVVMVHDWNEINPDFLEKKYAALKDRKHDEAYFDYWFRLIKDTQKKVRNHEVSFSQLEATRFSHQDLTDLHFILNQYGDPNCFLFYKGFLTAVRPLQIAQSIASSYIFLSDPYMDVAHLDKYLVDRSLLANQNKLFLMNEDQFPFWLGAACSVFLDLTYYRTSLFVNFGKSVIEYGNFRQSLKQDLTEFFFQIKAKSLLCGNMADNPYVKEVLDMFAQENDIAIQRQGAFWFFIKD